jgi:hypothetical protein
MAVSAVAATVHTSAVTTQAPALTAATGKQIAAGNTAATAATTYPVLVNGYLCFSAAEVAAAGNSVVVVNGVLCFTPAEVQAARAFQATSDTTSATTVTGTGTRYPITVNGRLCFSETEARAARNFAAMRSGDTIATAEQPHCPRVVNGVLCFDDSEVRSARNFTTGTARTAAHDVNMPLLGGTRGTMLNMLA